MWRSLSANVEEVICYGGGVSLLNMNTVALTHAKNQGFLVW